MEGVRSKTVVANAGVPWSTTAPVHAVATPCWTAPVTATARLSRIASGNATAPRSGIAVAPARARPSPTDAVTASVGRPVVRSLSVTTIVSYARPVRITEMSEIVMEPAMAMRTSMPVECV